MLGSPGCALSFGGWSVSGYTAADLASVSVAAPPMTRREAREREALAAAAAQADADRAAEIELAAAQARVVSPAITRVVSRVLIASAIAATTVRAVAARVPARSELAERARALAPRRPSQGELSVQRELTRSAVRPHTATSSLLSVGALLLAGALLVSTSIPASALMMRTMTQSDAASPSGTITADAVAGEQTLNTEAGRAAISTGRDTFDVTSNAQQLALKYSGVDYSYSATSGAVRWPFPYTVPITDGFGPRDSGFHKGTDFAAGPGTPIYAIADGRVIVAVDDESGYGQHVLIQHRLGGVDVVSLYGHMIEGSSPVTVGEYVNAGDFLGLVGETGVAYGPHLHFEIHVDGVPVDPFAWLEANASN